MAGWTDGHKELAEVAGMLVDLQALDSAEDVVDFLEKPWKWETERDAWISADRPHPTDAGWELFTARTQRA